MDEKCTYYRQLESDFLWLYGPIFRTDTFIVNGADLEYTKQTYTKN